MPRSGIAILSLLLSAQLSAQTPPDWTAVNLALTDTIVIPAYGKFAENATTLQQQSASFCSDITPASLVNLQTNYQLTLDTWQAMQNIQFGPITYFNWNYRLQYWPDDNGTGARQLAALISSKDVSVLNTETFARQSVGVQGFQALELLLFSEQSLALLQGDPYQCQLVQTISANISEIASGVMQRWVDEFRSTIATADERGFFESAQDATIDFLKATVEPIRTLQRQKLEAVLGENFAASRIRRAESWRADRSIRNMRINVASIDLLFNGASPALSSVLPAEDIEGINASIILIKTTLDSLPDSMAVVLQSEAGYNSLKQVASEFDALYELLEASLKKTDLYLGFNSLDGD
jgi:uncharacterized protein